MKYIVIDDKNGDMFTCEFDKLDEAISEADKQWSYLSNKEKDTREIIVLESVNPDEDAEDHFDGNVVYTRSKLYVADRETGSFIEAVYSIEDGEDLISEYEAKDREEDTYTDGFYDIVDKNHCSVR